MSAIVNNKKVVISLYDFTGEALRPWAEAGYTCLAVDIQHDNKNPILDTFSTGGSIRYMGANLHDNDDPMNETFKDALSEILDNLTPVMGMAFPVCTDLAVSGARHFKAKAAIDPEFQDKAAEYAILAAAFFETIEVPYFIENPVSVLATKWRKPDYTFHPYEYGGYIPDSQGEHPRWPDYIADFDAYPKRTCLWTGGGFKMPTRYPVDVEDGYSDQYKKLGGKSDKTKNIRSATPRGFARAVFEANNDG